MPQNKGCTPWNKGKKGLQIAWNKGKKHSLETINNIKKSLVGKNIGKDNASWKGGITKIIRFCPDCKKQLKHYLSKYCFICSFKHRILPSHAKEKHYRWNGGRPKCKDCKKEIEYKAKFCSSCSKLGSRNNSWRNGISFEDYSLDFNNVTKKKIKERDKYKCRICNFSSLKGLVVHHINYNKKDCNLINLITLCNVCHSKTNYNRKAWLLFFKEITG